MKVSRENGENQQVVLTIEAAAEEWDKAIAQAAKNIAKEVNIPGFRRGKAPRHIIEQRIGKEALIDEAYEKFGPKVFDEAMAEEKLELASYPSFERVQAEEGKPFILKDDMQAGVFKLPAEVPDFLRLEAFRSVHIQGKAGQNPVRLKAVTDCFNSADIGTPAHAADYFHRTGNNAGRVGNRNADPDIPDIQTYNAFVHVH